MSRIPDQDLIEDLKEVAEVCQKTGRSLTRLAYDQLGKYGKTTLCDRFGNWSQAKLEAGLAENTLYDARVRREKRRNYNFQRGEKIREELQNYVGKYFRIPNKRRFRTAATISDIHDLYHDPFTLRVFFDFLQGARPDRVCFNGDIFDGTESNRYHKDGGDYRPIDRHRFVRDKIFKKTREILPDAQIDFQLGNHELNFLRHISEGAGSMRDILQEIHGMSLAKFLCLDEFEITLQSRLEFTGWTKKDDANTLAQDVLVIDDAFLVCHKPQFRKWNMPGVSGHIHKWITHNVYRVVKGDRLVGQWIEQGAACRKKASYCDAFHWQQGFTMVHWDNLDKWVQLIPVDTTGTHAYCAGKGYLRKGSEMLHLVG